MQPVAIVSGHLKKGLQHFEPFTLLHSQYDCRHSATVKPELNLVCDQALPHQVLKVGMVMQEPQVRDGQLDPGVSQGGAGEEE